MDVERVDHVHVEVSDRVQAANWYARVLSLTPDPRFSSWAEHPSGPLILSASSGVSVLALFERPFVEHTRDSTVALRVSGEDFAHFVQALPGLALKNKRGETVTAQSVVDHDLAWSIYFVDLDGNPLEVTTYDRGAIA
ncbi:MAG: VOC family protein [Pseudomonadota bacterium]